MMMVVVTMMVVMMVIDDDDDGDDGKDEIYSVWSSYYTSDLCYFPCISSFHPHNNLYDLPLLFPFEAEKLRLKEFNNLPKFIQIALGIPKQVCLWSWSF